MAFAAACAGYHVLLVELEGYSNLSHALGLESLSYEPSAVDPSLLAQNAPDADAIGRLEVMQLRPDEALADYLDHTGLGPLVRRFSRSEAVEVVSTAAPGIRDLVTMGKVRQMEEAEVAELIVVDAPASGHAISLLTSPAGLAASADSGPVKEQADLVVAMLTDESRCQVVLVTLPEETPVTETIETAFALEDEVGVSLGPLVINGLWPEIAGLAEAAAAAEVDGRDPAGVEAAYFRLAKIADQQREVRRLDEELPLPQLHLPQLFTTSIGPEEIATLAEALRSGAR